MWILGAGPLGNWMFEGAPPSAIQSHTVLLPHSPRDTPCHLPGNIHELVLSPPSCSIENSTNDSGYRLRLVRYCIEALSNHRTCV